MRSMSFFLTTRQILDRSKTVTRRRVNTWTKLKVGDVLKAVEKVQGLKKGERQRVLGKIQITGVRVESLCEMSDADCLKEGFPIYNSGQFIRMFVNHMGGEWDQQVRRIEFKYV